MAAHSFLLMLSAAPSSAVTAKPHCWQRNDSCDFRLAFSRRPQRLQVRLVFLESTRWTGTPARATLLMKNVLRALF